MMWSGLASAERVSSYRQHPSDPPREDGNMTYRKKAALIGCMLLSTTVIWAQALGPLGSFQAPIQNWGTASGARYSPQPRATTGITPGMGYSPSAFSSYRAAPQTYHFQRRVEPRSITSGITGAAAAQWAITKGVTAGMRWN